MFFRRKRYPSLMGDESKLVILHRQLLGTATIPCDCGGTQPQWSSSASTLQDTLHWISIQIALQEKLDGPLTIVDMNIVPEFRQRKREKIATEYDKGCLISP